MYSTKTATYGILSDILSQLTDYDIFAYYLGNFKIGKLYNSPLRTDDDNPSFAIFKSRYNTLMFKDHGSGLSGTAFTFVKEMLNTNSERDLEKEFLKIIKSTARTPNRNISRLYKSRTSCDIGIVRQDWTEQDIMFWKQFGITIPTLNKFQVFSIKYFLCNKIVSGIYKDTNPMYAFKINDKFKIYRPLNSKYTKWRNNLTSRDIQGMSQLPEHPTSDILIITKSLKDVMVLYEMGYDAISPSSETTFIPGDILTNLKIQYKYIFILYDRDKAGVKQERIYSKRYNIIPILINKKFKAKDISDAVKLNGFDVLKTWLKKELAKYDVCKK